MAKQHDWTRALQGIMRQLNPQPLPTDGTLAGWDTEQALPQFSYPGNPQRNPFAPPPGVSLQNPQTYQPQPMAQPVDARGQTIAPQILAAMDRMRQAQARGFKTSGQQAEDQFHAAHGTNTRSAIWG